MRFIRIKNDIINLEEVGLIHIFENSISIYFSKGPPLRYYNFKEKEKGSGLELSYKELEELKEKLQNPHIFKHSCFYRLGGNNVSILKMSKPRRGGSRKTLRQTLQNPLFGCLKEEIPLLFNLSGSLLSLHRSEVSNEGKRI